MSSVAYSMSGFIQNYFLPVNEQMPPAENRIKCFVIIDFSQALAQDIPGTGGHRFIAFVLHDHIQMHQTDR
jgi:hypothetical protein